MNILSELNLINANTKFTKNSSINDIKLRLSEFEQLLKLKFAYQMQGLTPEQVLIQNSAFSEAENNVNYCLFLYIYNYKYLSTNKKELSEIKAICLKIMHKYQRYFNAYNKQNNIST